MDKDGFIDCAVDGYDDDDGNDNGEYYRAVVSVKNFEQFLRRNSDDNSNKKKKLLNIINNTSVCSYLEPKMHHNGRLNINQLALNTLRLTDI